MIQVERHYIKGSDQILVLCQSSKELYNRCNFLMRQAWINHQTLPDISKLIAETQPLECFKNLHNTKTAKQTIRKCLTDWTNFKKALNAYKKDSSKFLGRPKPPHYKKRLAQVVFYNETIKGGQSGKLEKQQSGMIIPTNDCFSIESDRIYKQVVITKKTFGFIVETYS